MGMATPYYKTIIRHRHRKIPPHSFLMALHSTYYITCGKSIPITKNYSTVQEVRGLQPSIIVSKVVYVFLS